MSKKPDLRVIRTKKLIKEAFTKLLEEKGYERITIQDIADKAMINRATFYLHYADKQDLLEKMSDEILEGLKSQLPSRDLSQKEISLVEAEAFLTPLLEKISENASFYRIMLGKEGGNVFRTKVEEIFWGRLEEIFSMTGLQENTLSVPKGLVFQYMYSGYIGIVMWWLDSGMIYSPGHMASLMSKLLLFGYVQVIGFTVKDTGAK